MYIRLASRHVAACLTAADHTKVQRLHAIARSGDNCEALVRFPHAVEILCYTINPTQALVLQTWRAIKYKDLGRLLTHARTSYMEVKSWEEQVRQCKAYIEEACPRSFFYVRFALADLLLPATHLPI